MKKVVCFDLDDTLSKEINYLKSAYRKIASYAVKNSSNNCCYSISISAIKAYNEMLTAYNKGENAFEKLNLLLGVDVPILDYLTIYRNHKPNIRLEKETADMLNILKERDCILVLISDGRSVQQRNKFNALGLNKWIEPNNIIISEEFGSEKPSIANYEYFMHKYPQSKYYYIGDNVEKDFIAPNHLGWITICLLDNGYNIHKQIWNIDKEKLPQIKISNINELINIII